jgi:hypothetical protein
MTPQLHTELKALYARYPLEELSEEEWALLQVHMAYCDACQRMFTRYEPKLPDRAMLENPAASLFKDNEDVS